MGRKQGKEGEPWVKSVRRRQGCRTKRGERLQRKEGGWHANGLDTLSGLAPEAVTVGGNRQSLVLEEIEIVLKSQGRLGI